MSEIVTEPTKKMWYESKRFYLHLLGIVALAVPSSAQFIADNFGETSAIWMTISAIVSFISKDKIKLFG